MNMDPQVIDGIHINPKLPKGFFDKDNEKRPKSHMAWWDVPFIQTYEHAGWPEGVRYDVYVLDGGAWDRPTHRGWFGSLNAALAFVKEGAPGIRTDSPPTQQTCSQGQMALD